MKTIIKLHNLDKPSRNGYYLTKDALDEALKRLHVESLPLKLMSLIDDNSINIGQCYLGVVEYPEIRFYAKIESPVLEPLLKNNIGGFNINCIAGATEGNCITKIDSIDCIGYTINPAYVSSYEIVKEFTDEAVCNK